MSDAVIEQIARDLGSVFLPVGLRMLAGLVIGIIIAAAFNTLYRRTNRMHKSGFVGFIAIVLCAGAGLLVPLTTSLEPALVGATDVVIPEIARQLEPDLRAQGLNPQAIDGVQVSRVLDEVLEEMQRNESLGILSRQEAAVRDAMEDVRRQLGGANTISLTNLMVIVRDAFLGRFFRIVRFVTAILIAVPLVFMPTALGVAYMKQRQA